MTLDRKQPGVAFWVTVVVVVGLVGYPLSFGPACWLADNDFLPTIAVLRVYRPLVRTVVDRWAVVGPAIERYGTAMSPRQPFDTTVRTMVTVLEVQDGFLDADRSKKLICGPCFP